MSDRAKEIQLENIHSHLLEKFAPKAKELGVNPEYLDFVVDTVEVLLQEEVDMCIKNLLLEGVMKEEDFKEYLQRAKAKLGL